MKKTIILIAFMFIVLIVVIGIFFVVKIYFNKNNAAVNIPTPAEPSTVPILSTTPKPTFASSTKSNVRYITVRDASKITLVSNLKDKLAASEAKEKDGCAYLVSGGFYNQEGKHIGLFVSEQAKISEAISDPTFNGFFSIDTANNPTISTIQIANPRLSLQTGPILFRNSKPLALNLKSDESARRIIAAVNSFGHITFIVFFNQTNPIEGPTLSSLPKLVNDLNKDTNLDYDEAINLDGGAHSAFITDTVNIREISTIGSYFCIKP